jgi:uncharacterized Zn finger protein (UPF0148 family)
MSENLSPCPRCHRPIYKLHDGQFCLSCKRDVGQQIERNLELAETFTKAIIETHMTNQS